MKIILYTSFKYSPDGIKVVKYTPGDEDGNIVIDIPDNAAQYALRMEYAMEVPSESDEVTKQDGQATGVEQKEVGSEEEVIYDLDKYLSENPE